MRDFIRDSHGRFADVPGVGDDAPASRSATTPGGTRTSLPTHVSQELGPEFTARFDSSGTLHVNDPSLMNVKEPRS